MGIESKYFLLPLRLRGLTPSAALWITAFLCCAPSSAAMANLEQWVNDRLHDILGLSDRYVSQFMIGIARKSSSSQDFVTRLEETGTIDIEPSVVTFAQELFDKVYSTLIPLLCML